MMVLLMASSHTSASVEVLRWLLSPGGRIEREKAKGKGGGVDLGVYWHTLRPQCVFKNNMQTPAFMEINTLPQRAQSASGE